MKFDIKITAILKILLVVFLAWVLIQLKQVIIILFIAFIVATAIRPLVKRLEIFKIPRGLSIAAIYLSLLALITALIYIIAKPLANELISLSSNLPGIITTIQEKIPALSGLDLQGYLNGFKNNLSSTGENLSGNINTAIHTLTGLFDVFTSLLTIFIVSLYLTLGLDEIIDGLIKFVPAQKRERVLKNYKKVEEQVGAWLRGQLILMLIIGTTTYIVLKILGIPFALPLALFAGLMEILPIIGPIVYSVAIIAVALTVSPITAILSAIACLIIQQAEGHFIVPFTMKKAVGLSPVATIIAILSGGTLFGVVGALLAVPVAAVLSAIIKDIFIKDN